jgi:F-type H+-transporting ATPase subunit b
MLFLAGVAGVIQIDGTVIVELITFLLMLAILARYVYPEIVRLAEARQRVVAEQLKEAEQSRADAEERLKEAEAKLVDARKTAQNVLEAANKSGEQLRQELRQKAEEESKRTVDAARKEIEAERDEAVRSVRKEVAELVVAATEKVIGETLDDDKQRKLIDRAIAEVASGDGSRRQGGS